MKIDRTILNISIFVTSAAILALLSNWVASVLFATPLDTPGYYIIIIILTAASLVFGFLQILPRLPLLRDLFSNRLEYPIKITWEIEGAPITIETPDLERAEDILKLAQRLQENHSYLAASKTTQKIIQENQGMYLARSTFRTASEVLEHKDLQEAQDKLDDLVNTLVANADTLENPDEVLDSTRVVAEELSKEKPNKLTITAILNSIASSVRSSIVISNAVEALKNSVASLL